METPLRISLIPAFDNSMTIALIGTDKTLVMSPAFSFEMLEDPCIEDLVVDIFRGTLRKWIAQSTGVTRR